MKTYPKIVLSNGEKKITLYSVIHISTKQFYTNVREHVLEDMKQGATVHLEGVVKLKPKKSEKAEYGSLASTIELFHQKEELNDHLIGAKYVDYLYEDLSFVDKMRIKIIKKMIRHVNNFLMTASEEEKEQWKQDLIKMNPTEKVKKSTNILVGKNMIDGRTRYAAQHALLEKGDVSLVWGAAHIPLMKEILMESGYEIIEEVQIPTL